MFPEIRVTRKGGVAARVVWDSGDGDVVDLSDLFVLRVETEITTRELPSVKVTFRARLVEVETNKHPGDHDFEFRATDG